ncbi:MAG: signal peptidase I [Armatimonadota bacterium]|nr:signal peptidase I [Armatimonadota bacterium]MDR7427743.1 signal peptidase I [Armatimonadota bacterium]MDR7464620.1 signal peptidase I [Armatimonadota bacterium]MDR7469655.1 signal peptidase I [Armatimonadota bacterium]MDR7474915.1 signal peptidase I [Armatimonadota bacterium]
MTDPTPGDREDTRRRITVISWWVRDLLATRRPWGRIRSGLAASHPWWRRARATVVETAKTLLIAFLLAQLIMVSVAQAFQVEQYSMEPTLLPHDRVLVSKFIYRLREPARGDVIVLRYPRNPERNYIKRVIGLPGETIAIRQGTLYVNGQPIREDYLNGETVGDFGPVTVPLDSVFVMGDNRNNSEDSRAFGPLKRTLIVGQAILIYWPPQRLRLIAGR